MNLRSFFFPKNYSEKKQSIEMGFFILMISYFSVGLVLFFALTGIRLKSLLRYPILILLLILMNIGMFYLSYLTRKLAISTREASNYEDLRTVVIFFQKRVFQLFHLPLILIGIVMTKLNEFYLGYSLIGFALAVQIIIYLTDWKLIHRKLG